MGFSTLRFSNPGPLFSRFFLLGPSLTISITNKLEHVHNKLEHVLEHVHGRLSRTAHPGAGLIKCRVPKRLHNLA